MTGMAHLPSSIKFIERDWLSANHILAFDNEGATLVDTGYDKHKALTAALINHALAGQTLRKIINTHLHADHCGGNALLQSTHRCEIGIPESSWQDVVQWDDSALIFQDTAQTCDRFEATFKIAPGDTWQMGGMQWQAIAAPGHDEKSLIYFAPEEKILISADALWASGFGVLFPELEERSGVTEQAAVLDVIEALAPRIVLPGHGPYFTDVAAALAKSRARLTAMGHDPAKHARNALRVLVKFLLLDRERVEIAALPIILEHAKILQNASKLLGLEMMTAIERAYSELLSAGHIHLSSDRKALLNDAERNPI
jgi:glyoxylase-like metal-dependent hydrolase (beta-lactamase superfamily II)